MEEILNPALVAAKHVATKNTPKSRVLPEVARATYTQKRQVASATFTSAGAKSRTESKKVCQ
ncbi:hypothetical protein JCGZ_06400 [Jatropha curcas]|uniref:Uncharacterized protein n=1 Tax=Jatropha curcas TaxID=180498 RepID=A0A067L024_JATCU|nr:hypothetical protein JCGZ_06400 [Jatropha curcas]